MHISDLVRNAGMSARPGYYSGRGATSSDLNSKILNDIASLIEKHYGKQAHDNYVKMVWGMSELSATAFLNNLYALERASWKLTEAKITNDGQSFESEGEALGLLAEVFSQSYGRTRPNQTESIRHGFRKVL